MVYAGQRDDFLAGTLRLRKLELAHHLFRSLRRVDFFHPIDLLELALCLGSLAGLRPETICKGLQRSDFLLLIFICSQLLICARLLLNEIRLVIAAIAVESAATEFDGGINELIQKFAVVGNHENSTAIQAQMFLKPAEGFQIEVVGWFVQQQQIRFLDEQPRQVSAHDPTAAQRACGPFKIRVTEGETFQNLFGTSLDTPAVFIRKNFQCSMMLLGVLRRRSQCPVRLRECWRDRTGEVQHAFVPGGRTFLGEKAVIGTAFPGDGAGIRRLGAENYGEQGGLARAVRADQTDAISTVELEGGVFKQDATAEGFRDLGKR